MISKHRRALSPHLTIYKPQITSVLSILHRMSGVFNFFGMLALLWWVVSIAYTSTPYSETLIWQFFNSMFGLLILIAWTFSLFLHMCTGIRHLFWDAGLGYELKTVKITGYLALITASLLTIACWGIIYLQIWGDN